MRKVSIYAKASDVKSGLFTNQPRYVLMCTKRLIFLLTNLTIPCIVLLFSLLQDFEDVFFEKTPSGLPAKRGIEHQSILSLVLQFQIDQLIDVILRK